MKIRRSEPPEALRPSSPTQASAPAAVNGPAIEDSFQRKPSKARPSAPPAPLPPSPFRGPIGDRALPPLALALTSDDIRPLGLDSIAVPPEVTRALQASKRVLVVGHVFPDGDAIGSAVGLARALNAAGKAATPCVDDATISGKFRSIADSGELKTAKDLDDQRFDTVVIVDVAEANRIGGAKAFVEKADRVVVIDHHQVEATREGLGLGEKQKLVPWVDRRAEAAAFLVAAAASKLVPETSADAWKQIAPPLLSAMLTDTLGFSQNGVSEGALRIFKHVLGAHASGALDPIAKRLDYELPRESQAVLDGLYSRIEDPATRAEVRRLRADHPRRSPAPRSAIMVVPKRLAEVALEVGKKADPGVNENDVKGALIDRVERIAKTVRVAVLMVEGDGGAFVSVRSEEPGLALELAEALGGGGHSTKAAARPKGTLEEIQKTIGKWLDRWSQLEQLQLRAGR